MEDEDDDDLFEIYEFYNDSSSEEEADFFNGFYSTRHRARVPTRSYASMPPRPVKPIEREARPGEEPHVLAMLEVDLYEYPGAREPLLYAGDTVKIEGSYSEASLSKPSVEYLVYEHAIRPNADAPASNTLYLYLSGDQLSFLKIVNGDDAEPPFQLGYPEWARQPENSDELPLVCGQSYTLFEPSTDPGWRYAVSRGVAGLVPINYFPRFFSRPDDLASSAADQPAEQGAEMVDHQQDTNHSETLCIDQPDPHALSPLNGQTKSGSAPIEIDHPGSKELCNSSLHVELPDAFSTHSDISMIEHPQSSAPLLSQAAPSEQRNQHPPTRPIIYCQAAFSYHATQIDELSFTQGDQLVLYNQSEDSGWWQGALINRPFHIGLVPETHLIFN